MSIYIMVLIKLSALKLVFKELTISRWARAHFCVVLVVSGGSSHDLLHFVNMLQSI